MQENMFSYIRLKNVSLRCVILVVTSAPSFRSLELLLAPDFPQPIKHMTTEQNNR